MIFFLSQLKCIPIQIGQRMVNLIHVKLVHEVSTNKQCAYIEFWHLVIINSVVLSARHNIIRATGYRAINIANVSFTIKTVAKARHGSEF